MAGRTHGATFEVRCIECGKPIPLAGNPHVSCADSTEGIWQADSARAEEQRSLAEMAALQTGSQL